MHNEWMHLLGCAGLLLLACGAETCGGGTAQRVLAFPKTIKCIQTCMCGAVLLGVELILVQVELLQV